jgi:transcription factor C subunit 6
MYVAEASFTAVLTHYFPVHQTSIQSVSWIRAPQTKGDGSAILNADPTIVCSTGSEGVVKLTDIRDHIPRLLVRNREIPHASAYSCFCGSLLATDVDFWVKLFQMQAASLGKGHFMMDVGGAALVSLVYNVREQWLRDCKAISVSDLHPIMAVGSADGACTTTNMLRGVRREAAVVGGTKGSSLG